MQQLVIKNGKILATHTSEQDLRDKYPGCEIVLHRESGVGLGDPDPRTPKEKRNSYADARRMAYPTIEEQLDMMYHGTWRDAITEVKERFPKSSET